jgi:hypothetical protein
MLRRLLPLMLVAAAVLAQSSPQRGKPTEEASITVEKPRYTYQQTFSAITAVDWKNLAYYSLDDKGKPFEMFRLRAGAYHDKDNSQKIRLANVFYLGKPQQYAVVQIDETDCGANCTDFPAVYVFRLVDDRLTVLQAIGAEVHHIQGGIVFDPKTEMLTVRATNYGDGPHCCPEYIDVVTYKWTDSEFEQAERKTVPNPDWKP